MTVSFDETGLVGCTYFQGGQLDAYVVGLWVDEVGGYEFLLDPSFPPAFLLGKILYAAGELDLGIEFAPYEVRAQTYECMTDPSLMGPSSHSWTLAKFQLGYFSGVNDDMYYCLAGAPSSSVGHPQFALCDGEGTIDPRAWPFDLAGIAPDGCAVANPSYGHPGSEYCDRRTIPTANASWGTLKSQFSR